MKPTTSLAARDLKNEPCPQSWKMMNTRTRNAPARIGSGSVIQYDTAVLRNIKYQSSAYGPRVLMICKSARHVEGFWYCATISFQAAVSAWRLSWVELESSLINCSTEPWCSLAGPCGGSG